MGAAFQVSTLLIQATGRVDLLIVYKLRNPAEAGTYSVALTIGALVILMPWAVSYATFPRIARLEPAAANILICRCVRTGVAAATLSAVALAALSPLAVPLVFGPDYSPAVGPSLVLLLAGILGGCQMVLSRGIAARGETRPLIISYLVNLAVMVGLDFALIPLFGTMGAAAAFAFSSLAGLSVAVAFYCRNGGSIGNLVPRVEDLTGLLSALPIHTRWTRRP
jgi:O-antigen/teichoic acid export membrane protein